MKLTTIENFAGLGVYVDDLDMYDMSVDEWKSLKEELYNKYLLIIFRNTNLKIDDLSTKISQWGTSSFGLKNLLRPYNLSIKNIGAIKSNLEVPGFMGISKEDMVLIAHSLKQMSPYGKDATVIKLVGSIVDDSKFLEGELHWHQDEGMDVAFCDSIALFGSQSMTASATGFATTAGWFERQTESFKSELQDMIVEHEFHEEDFSENMDPVELDIVRCSTGFDSKLPLVINSRGGFTGLHIPPNTATKILGISQNQSDALLTKIKNEILSAENVYDHWYQQDNDLLIFDNSITMHRRLGSTFNRIAYRVPFDMSDPVASRYTQPEFQQLYKDVLTLFSR